MSIIPGYDDGNVGRKKNPTAHSVVQTSGGVADHILIDSQEAVSHSWWQQWHRVAAVVMKDCLFEPSDCDSVQDTEVRASGNSSVQPEALTDANIAQTWNTPQIQNKCEYLFWPKKQKKRKHNNNIRLKGEIKLLKTTVRVNPF